MGIGVQYSLANVDVEIQYLPNAHHLEILDVGDWIDCYTYEQVRLKKGNFKLISLGFAAKLPEGYEALVVPRSSTFLRYGILQTNSLGVIDSSYCGPQDIWKMPVYATRNILIAKNTRLCQFRIVRNQPEINFKEVKELENKNRSGFGSSGI